MPDNKCLNHLKKHQEKSRTNISLPGKIRTCQLITKQSSFTFNNFYREIWITERIVSMSKIFFTKRKKNQHISSTLRTLIIYPGKTIFNLLNKLNNIEHTLEFT